MSSIEIIFDKIISALSSFNFTTDLIDVILVAFVIFEAIRLVRSSRTFQLVKGIGLLAVVFVVVKLLHMEASEFLLTILFQNGLIIFVVLFSPELRKMLERIGRQSIKNIPFLNFGNGESYNETVTNTVNSFCKATADMSESKTGALVVFEKDIALQEIINSGTVVDARASVELFNGIFFKNSALHDGAVIVRDGRIYSAGCILPLTQNTALASELGTRHRAAIGMSEQSDSVVVVVSEETGLVSVAKNGELNRGVTNGQLREILLGELVSTDEDKKSRKKKGASRNEKK